MSAEAYVAGALERACEEVRNAPVGERHNTLNRAAFSIGGLVGAHLPAERARAALEEAGLAAAPEEAAKVRSTVRRALEEGARAPREVPTSPVPRARRAPPATWASWCAGRGLDARRIAEAFEVREVRGGEIEWPTVAGMPLRWRTLGAPKRTGWRRGEGKGGAHAYGLAQAKALLGEEHPGPLYVVNGEPAVWAAWQSGVAAVCWGVGEGATPSRAVLLEALEVAEARPIRVVYDVDAAGRTGAHKVAAALAEVGAQDVAVLELPAALGAGGDVDDLHRRTGDAGLAEALAALPVAALLEEGAALAPFALTSPPVAEEARPVLAYVPGEEGELVRGLQAALAAAAERMRLFVLGGELVQVQSASDGAPVPVTPDGVRALVADVVTLERTRAGKGGEPVTVRAGLSRADAAMLMTRRDWRDVGVPELRGIVAAPYFAADGRIVDTEGFDPHSGYFLARHGVHVVKPVRPSREDARAALQRLWRLVDEVPWGEECGDPFACGGFATWVGALLTLLARPSIAGPVPALCIEANVNGAGKTALARLLGCIALGRAAPERPLSADDEERRKALLAVARLAAPLIVFDNVRGTIGGAALEALLTSEVVSDRVLGASHTIDVPWRSLLVLTSNNAQVTPDARRRLLWCRLSTPEERPAERTGWRIADREAYALEHRSELVSAALTVLAAWHVAGRPSSPLVGRGAFSAWSAIRHALCWCGLPDPWAELAPEVADPETEALAEVLAVWHLGVFYRAADMLGEHASAPPALRSAVLDAVPHANALRVGRYLAQHRDRVVDGRCLAVRKNRTGVSEFTVRAVPG